MGHHVFNPARLEAFSDGVIAVIITIMVLELKVPQQDGIAGLRAVLPTLCLSLISFTFTGIYWINHHQLVHRTQEADELILYANLGFLFCLSLLPFFPSSQPTTRPQKAADSFSYPNSCFLFCLPFFPFLPLTCSTKRWTLSP